MKRLANPLTSALGEIALAQYRQVLHEQEDLADTPRRNYLSDLRHFIAWCETHCMRSTSDTTSCQVEFDSQAITTQTLTSYRSYLQRDLRQKPNSVNRALVSLKRYFSWTMQKQLITYDPSTPVKLVGQEEGAPRHLDDQEEVATVTKEGILRDRTLIVLLLHTGLRAQEMCQLRQDQVKLGKRSGTLEIIGKRNKYREVPLNVTARKVLKKYIPTLSAYTVFHFLPARQKKPYQNVHSATLSKSMLMERNSWMLARTTSVTVSAIVWLNLSHFTD